ncbi:hypothetical protein GN244_ATG06349 [Phytophthora infestans]|uniref:Uncharacterized protein n=1 Tax=Phytophthora infestans TaxID=4787 RepID=A0A833WJS5_PHYIN|nr:hypothetical protein GN244_ATG09633 [Phytophthora infestans]KAF4041352.1 hypothetical protein GN244_ATG06349 [Phytophthora infestans]KAF4132607.1 hypothetical protein GN958_ATG18184 [Phytophthora infestans]
MEDVVEIKELDRLGQPCQRRHRSSPKTFIIALPNERDDSTFVWDFWQFWTERTMESRTLHILLNGATKITGSATWVWESIMVKGGY